MNKKMICISVPCRNEENNVVPLTEAIISQFKTNLPQYDFTIQFIDNDSQDNTRLLLRQLCAKYSFVRAIFNTRNFEKSGAYGIRNAYGDASISMAADFQNPPELIPQLVHEWENGAAIVCAIKSNAKENKLLWAIRTMYYKIIQKLSSVEQIPHFTGFGLYDRKFMDLLRSIEDPTPTMRGYVAEFGWDIKKVYFEQPPRKSGKSKNNFFSLFEIAMLNLTTYTKIGMHLAMICGVLISLLSFIVGLIYLVLKLIYWENFSAGMVPILVGVFFLGAIQLFFIGLLGEYVMATNNRVRKRPLVVEKERINFLSEAESDKSEAIKSDDAGEK